MREGDLQPFLVAFPTEDGDQQVMLDPGYFNGPDEVGIFLVDLARHYARAFVQNGQAMDEGDALERIRELFDMEWMDPTDEGEGGAVS